MFYAWAKLVRGEERVQGLSLRSWPFARVFILQVASITQAHCVISGAAGCVNEIVSSATSPGSFLELCFVELGYSRADPLFTHTALTAEFFSLLRNALQKNSRLSNTWIIFIHYTHILNQISFFIILTPLKLTHKICINAQFPTT